MKKIKEVNNSYKNTLWLKKEYTGISALEQQLISLIKGYNLITFNVIEVRRLSNFSLNQIHNLLFSLKKKGVLIQVKKGHYVLKEGVKGREFEIATNLVNPSYVSFWTAMSYYGFTEQQVKTIQLVSNKQVKSFEFMGHRVEIASFSPNKFFGYKRVDGFNIAEKEKALVDSLSNLEKAGGVEEFAKCLKNAWDEINKKKFIDYLIKFNNNSMISRAGFLIEKQGLKLSKKQTKRLINRKSSCFVKLAPSQQKSKTYDKKWMINVNVEIKGEEVI